MVVIIRALVVLTAVVLVLLLLLWVFQRRLIYLPDQTVAPVAQVLPGGQQVQVETADELRLAAWYLRGGPTGVLVLPGNAGDRADRAPLARALAATGLSVMLLDYRGFGGNPGRPTETGLVADARAARTALEQRPEIRRVVLFGESLGAAVAVTVAAERAPDAVVLRSPFTALVDVARVHYPLVPAGLLLKDRFEVLEPVRSVGAPLLVVTGTADRIVPLRLSRQVFRVAGEPKRMIEVPGAGHNDPALQTGRRMLSGIGDFLREHGVAGTASR